MDKFAKCPLKEDGALKIWEEMMSGAPYDALNPYLIEMLGNTRMLIRKFNDCAPSQQEEMHRILDEILGHHGEHFHFNQPFRCDYGCNISIGENFFANFNLTILDEAKVEIGDFAFIGPNVSIYTACHPLNPEERNKGTEWSEPVKIGNNVWIGGNVTILPGVTIGDNCTIGAGSVVSKEISSNTVAVGNPCRPIRKI